MGLPIKPSPKQLDPDVIEVVWPGDSAVDLDQSDLLEWCIGLANGAGKAGLVFGDEEPQVIKIKALGTRALSRVMQLASQNDPCSDDEAFRFGVVSVSDMNLSRDRFGGVRGLHDRMMDQFESITMKLPYFAIIDTINGEEEVRDESFMVPMTKVLGAAVVALSFRSGR